MELLGALPRKELLHPYYFDSIKVKKDLLEITGDEYPEYMAKNRPRESETNAKYRKETWDNVAKPFVGRITKTLFSISQNSDYNVQFPIENDPTDNLQTYLTENFGAEGNMEKWLWREVVDNVRKDPNAVLMYLPIEAIDTNNRREVVGKIIPCENVWVHKKGEFAVLVSDEKTPLSGQI